MLQIEKVNWMLHFAVGPSENKWMVISPSHWPSRLRKL